eukprot:Hpha_TRINITY_DN9062_c0_g1::TRINITY_DN9062_c0_g1_i1::g.141792::m.141792
MRVVALCLAMADFRADRVRSRVVSVGCMTSVLWLLLSTLDQVDLVTSDPLAIWGLYVLVAVAFALAVMVMHAANSIPLDDLMRGVQSDESADDNSMVVYRTLTTVVCCCLLAGAGVLSTPDIGDGWGFKIVNQLVALSGSVAAIAGYVYTNCYAPRTAEGGWGGSSAWFESAAVAAEAHAAAARYTTKRGGDACVEMEPVSVPASSPPASPPPPPADVPQARPKELHGMGAQLKEFLWPQVGWGDGVGRVPLEATRVRYPVRLFSAVVLGLSYLTGFTWFNLELRSNLDVWADEFDQPVRNLRQTTSRRGAVLGIAPHARWRDAPLFDSPESFGSPESRDAPIFDVFHRAPAERHSNKNTSDDDEKVANKMESLQVFLRCFKTGLTVGTCVGGLSGLYASAILFRAYRAAVVRFRLNAAEEARYPQEYAHWRSATLIGVTASYIVTGAVFMCYEVALLITLLLLPGTWDLVAEYWPYLASYAGYFIVYFCIFQWWLLATVVVDAETGRVKDGKEGFAASLLIFCDFLYLPFSVLSGLYRMVYFLLFVPFTYIRPDLSPYPRALAYWDAGHLVLTSTARMMVDIETAQSDPAATLIGNETFQSDSEAALVEPKESVLVTLHSTPSTHRQAQYSLEEHGLEEPLVGAVC